MTDHSDLIEMVQTAAEISGDELLHAAASALSSQSLSLSEALERCAGWAVSFAKKCEEHQEALREIERLKGLVAGIRECPQEPPGVVQLVWSDPAPPDGVDCFYDHVDADTPFGRFRIEWKSWKEYDWPSISFRGDYIDAARDVEAAKQLAADWWQSKLASCRPKPSKALENGPAVLADAHTNPASSDLSSLRKGAEVMREAIEDAVEKLNTYRGAAVQTVIDQLEAALVSGSREERRS